MKRPHSPRPPGRMRSTWTTEEKGQHSIHTQCIPWWEELSWSLGRSHNSPTYPEEHRVEGLELGWKGQRVQDGRLGQLWIVPGTGAFSYWLWSLLAEELKAIISLLMQGFQTLHSYLLPLPKERNAWSNQMAGTAMSPQGLDSSNTRAVRKA